MYYHQQKYHNNDDLRRAFLVNLGISGFELAGALMTGSMAILADVLHDLGDSLSLGLTWSLNVFLRRTDHVAFSDEYRRLSLAGSVLKSLILLAGGVFILSQLLNRLLNPYPLEGILLFFFALTGLIVNGVLAQRLFEQHSDNSPVIFWHLLEDTVIWLLVMVTGIVAYLMESPLPDKILALVLIVYTFGHVVRHLKQTVMLFFEMTPGNVNKNQLEWSLLTIDDVRGVENLRILSTDGRRYICSVQLLVSDDADDAQIARIRTAARKVFSELKTRHIAIEFVPVPDADSTVAHNVPPFTVPVS